MDPIELRLHMQFSQEKFFLTMMVKSLKPSGSFYLFFFNVAAAAAAAFNPTTPEMGMPCPGHT